AGTRGQSGSPLADSGFTFGGLRPRSNSIAIDGLDNTDETTGAARVALSPEIVREFQIINNGISAESGGAAGGAINVVTKTGTNTFHGDALVFGQNELFNARESVTAKAGVGRPLFHRYQPGVSLGGPIQHDRLNDISSRNLLYSGLHFQCAAHDLERQQMHSPSGCQESADTESSPNLVSHCQPKLRLSISPWV